MKFSAILAGLIGAIAAGSVAHAATYAFSYTGTDGHTFAGSFSGTLNGNDVDVTGVNSVTLDGTAFAGPLSAYSYIQGPAGGCTVNCFAPTGAVVSLTNPLDDNFLFIDSAGSPGPSGLGTFTNYFYVIPWSNGAGNPTAVQGLVAGVPYENYNGLFVPANFSVAAATPEPATWALMLLGIGGIGLAMRSSKRKPLVAAAA